jgi:hypothetical protein
MAAEPATLAVLVLAGRAAHGIAPWVQRPQFYLGRSRKVKLMLLVLARRRGTGAVHVERVLPIGEATSSTRHPDSGRPV